MNQGFSEQKAGRQGGKAKAGPVSSAAIFWRIVRDVSLLLGSEMPGAHWTAGSL